MPGRPFRLTAPVPLENDIHVACAQALDRLLVPPALWFAYPAGATELSPAQLAAHIRIGLKRSLPDLWFLYRGVYCIELKRPGGVLSRTRIVRTKRGTPRELIGQAEMFALLLASGAVRDIQICESVFEVFGQLEGWGFPLRGRVAA